MKKYITITALLLSSALALTTLSGCNNTVSPKTDNTSPNISNEISEPVSDINSDNSADDSDSAVQPVISSDITARFELPNGDPVNLTNAVVKGFDGEIPLTGKCWLSPETEGYDTKRDIHFVPDAESAKLLPLMYCYFDENGNEYTVGGEMNGFCFLTEHSDFYLGNADDHPELDLHEFPEDGSCIDVQITIDNIHCFSNKQWGVGFECDLADLRATQ